MRACGGRGLINLALPYSIKLSYHIMLAVFFLLEFVTQLLDYSSTIQLRQEFPTRSAQPPPSLPPVGRHPAGVLREGAPQGRRGLKWVELAIYVEIVYTMSTTKQ